MKTQSNKIGVVGLGGKPGAHTSERIDAKATFRSRREKE